MDSSLLRAVDLRFNLPGLTRDGAPCFGAHDGKLDPPSSKNTQPCEHHVLMSVKQHPSPALDHYTNLWLG
jgi:hypothetical protein